MEYRRAEVQDVDCLVDLRKRQLLEEGMQQAGTIDGALQEYFRIGLADESFLCWLAVKEEKIVATGGVCFYQLPPNFQNPSGRIAYITNMFTLPEYRRQGIASALLNQLLKEAEERKVNVLRLHASPDGRKIYQKFEFGDIGDFMERRL